MQQQTARIIVRTYAVLSWIAAAIIAGFACITDPQWLFDGTRAMLVLTRLNYQFSKPFFFIVAAFLVVLGLGLWHQREWARIATIILAFVSVPVGAILLYVCIKPHVCVSSAITQPLNALRLVLGLVTVYLFASKPILGLFLPAPVKPRIEPSK